MPTYACTPRKRSKFRLNSRQSCWPVWFPILPLGALGEVGSHCELGGGGLFGPELPQNALGGVGGYPMIEGLGRHRDDTKVLAPNQASDSESDRFGVRRVRYQIDVNDGNTYILFLATTSCHFLKTYKWGNNTWIFFWKKCIALFMRLGRWTVYVSS